MKTLRTAALLCLSALVLSACAHGPYHGPSKKTVYHHHQPSYYPRVYHPRPQVHVVRQPQVHVVRPQHHTTTIIRPAQPAFNRAYQQAQQHKPKHQPPRQWSPNRPEQQRPPQHQRPSHERNREHHGRNHQGGNHQPPRQQQSPRGNPRQHSGREQGGQRQQRVAR